MASNLIRVKDADAYKLMMPQIRGWVAKGSGGRGRGCDGEVRLVEGEWTRSRLNGGQGGQGRRLQVVSLGMD